MITAETDYRRILRRELEARALKDPRYSLRAFARDLKLSPSRLSEVLSGKQGLSRARAQVVASSLGLATTELALFCDLVESEHGRGAASRELARLRLAKRTTESSFHTVTPDTFQVVSDWYHFAILQLIALPSFRNDPAWIARALGISRQEARDALGRLKRLKFVEETRKKLQVSQEYVATTDGVPSAAIRKFHRQVLERALAALDEQPIERRNFSTVFLPIEKAKLDDAKRWIRNFRRRFSRKLGDASQSTDAVYCLAVQFFDVTPGLSRNEES